MDNLKDWGVHYISNRDIKHMDAVMFDIDDTLIFTNGQSNDPIIELLNIAVYMGYKIIIITARPGLEHVIGFTTQTTQRTRNHVQLFRFYECRNETSYEKTITL